MSKDTVVAKEVRETNNVIKTKDKSEELVNYKAKWEEARESLLIQHKESLEQIQIHKARVLKIEGTLEVNDQLFRKEEKGDS